MSTAPLPMTGAEENNTGVDMVHGLGNTQSIGTTHVHSAFRGCGEPTQSYILLVEAVKR